jgi:hypothetical protein
MKRPDAEPNQPVTKPSPRDFENVTQPESHLDIKSPKSPTFKKCLLGKEFLELDLSRHVSMGDPNGNVSSKVKLPTVDRFNLINETENQTTILHTNLAPDSHDIQLENTYNTDEEYRFRSSLPGADVAMSDNIDDSVGFTSYSNTTDWTNLPPSNRIRRFKRGQNSAARGLMSVSMPVPSISGNSQSEDSMFIAELYVRSHRLSSFVISNDENDIGFRFSEGCA